MTEETKKKVSLITSEMTAGRYPNCFKPYLGKDAKPEDKPKYGIPLLGTAAAIASPEFAAIQKAVLIAAQAKFGADAVKWEQRNGVLVEKGGCKIHSPFHMTEDDDEGQNPPEYIVRFNANGNDTDKPRVISVYRGPDGKVQDITDERLLFAGALVRVSVNVRAYDNPKRRGVGIYVNNVVLIDSDKPRLDNRRSADDEFGDVLQDGKMAVTSAAGGGDDDLASLLG